MKNPAPRPSRPRPLLSAVVALAVVVSGCSTFDDGDAAEGTRVDRDAADMVLADIAEQVLDGNSAAQGAPLEDGCPVLGERSIQDVVEAVGVDLDLDDPRESGFLNGVGEGVNVVCSVFSDEGSADITTTTGPALNATEFVAFNAPFAPDETSFEVGTDVEGFGPDSIVIRSRNGETTPIWVDNGLAIGVRLSDGSDVPSFDDHLAALSQAIDAVLETLQGDTDGPGGPAGDPAGIDRQSILEALEDIEPNGDDPTTQSLEDGPCPFMADEVFEDLVADLGWSTPATFNQGTSAAASRSVMCLFGDQPDVRSVAISFGRPLTVGEYGRYLDGHLNRSDIRIEPLDTSDDALGDDRSFTTELTPVGGFAGWVSNGLRITVTIATDDDPEEVLAAVVPAVLGELDLATD